LTSSPSPSYPFRYTLCDNFFHSAFGGSFLNQMFLIAAAAGTLPAVSFVKSLGINNEHPGYADVMLRSRNRSRFVVGRSGGGRKKDCA
jgi:phospholipase C